MANCQGSGFRKTGQGRTLSNSMKKEKTFRDVARCQASCYASYN